MSRGVRGEPLYTDGARARAFSSCSSETCSRYEWVLQAYCLMGNHFHLLVTTPEPTLSVGMQWLNSCYAQWFNWRHAYKGHVFFRRFHSVVIDSDSQLAEVARYVILNPVRARFCTRAEDWCWSSYRAMVGLRAGAGASSHPPGSWAVRLPASPGRGELRRLHPLGGMTPPSHAANVAHEVRIDLVGHRRLAIEHLRAGSLEPLARLPAPLDADHRIQRAVTDRDRRQRRRQVELEPLHGRA